jgi:DNA repair exonuclease SbcCD nuclease subunit
LKLQEREENTKSFSFIHTADLHLDSPFKELSEINNTISSELIESTFSAFNNIVDICLEKKVDFLLIAGDIYDGADRSLRAQLKFRDSLKRLGEAGIKTYIAHGNHDSLDGWSANLEWHDNVHIFKGKEVESCTFEKDGKATALIHGISFHKKDIRTNLSKKFPKKSHTESLFNIGILHCNIGTDTGHEPYAPCTLQDLISHNFDYWALGHVHNNLIINDSDPLVIYSGNIQGRHPRETGVKGCYLVKVDESGFPTYDFLEVDVVRWIVKEIKIDTMVTEQDFFSKIEDIIEKVRQEADGRSSICRIILSGRGKLYSSINRKGFLDDVLQELSESEVGEKKFVWIESFVNSTRSKIDKKSLLQRDDFIGDLLKLFEESLHNKQMSNELKEMLNSLLTSPGGRKFLESIDDKDFAELLRKAESLTINELMEE